MTLANLSARAMVMAETQISPEYLATPKALSSVQDLARTPPPAFLFLQIDLSKSKPETGSQANLATSLQDNRLFTG